MPDAYALAHTCPGPCYIRRARDSRVVGLRMPDARAPRPCDANCVAVLARTPGLSWVLTRGDTVRLLVLFGDARSSCAQEYIKARTRARIEAYVTELERQLGLLR